MITRKGLVKDAGQNTDSYERMQKTIALLQILAQGKEQIEAGKVQDTADVIANLRTRN